MAKAETYQNLITPISEVLTFFGKSSECRGYMYFSPFHDEKAPSLHVKVNHDGTWVWTDFSMPGPKGGPLGGGFVDLVRELSKRDARYAGMKLNEVICQISGNTSSVSISGKSSSTSRSEEASGSELDSVKKGLERRALVLYATFKRCIPESLVNTYCGEVTYHSVGRPERSFYGIGFKNNSGGWAVRSVARGRKINVGHGDISTLNKDGVLFTDGKASSPAVFLFEGFMDFLSFLAWCEKDTPGVDIVVLHSTSNVGRCEQFVKSHSEVRCFFDNDNAGNQATKMVEGWCNDAGVHFLDGRTAFKDHKDVNEAWQSVCAGRKEAEKLDTLRYKR